VDEELLAKQNSIAGMNVNINIVILRSERWYFGTKVELVTKGC
jgi:hypothetical protein